MAYCRLCLVLGVTAGDRVELFVRADNLYNEVKQLWIHLYKQLEDGLISITINEEIIESQSDTLHEFKRVM